MMSRKRRHRNTRLPGGRSLPVEGNLPGPVCGDPENPVEDPIESPVENPVEDPKVPLI